MSVFQSPDSAEGKERARWDRPRNQIVDGIAGMKNVGFEEYPKSIYRAGRPSHGNVDITGIKTVHSREQEDVAIGQGWSRSIEAAIDRVHATDRELAQAAAERAYTERTMSPAAQKEAATFEAETVQHVAEIPEKRRPGRPKKTV